MNKNIYKATTDQTSGEPIKNKFLDYEGVKHLWSKINMNDYPNNQTLIDVINAIDETKANKEDIVPADWDATEDEPGHVLNRPFYSEYGMKTLLEETTLTASEEEGMEGQAIIPYVVDLTGVPEVEVTYNGTKYVCPVTIDDSEGMVTFEFGDRSLMGDDIESTGEPFVAVFFNVTSAEVAGIPGVIAALDGSTTFTVSIAEITEIVHKIPYKFLPTSDWNASEGESGYISNRPFYSEFTENIILPKCYIEYDEDGNIINIPEIPSFNLIPGNEYAVNWNGVHYKCTAKAINIDGNVVAFVGDIKFVETGTPTTGEPFIIGTIPGQIELAPLDGSTSVAISIAELVKVVHKLDNKYLDLDWLPIIEKGVTLLEKTVVENNTQTSIKLTSPITSGQVIHVECDSIRYECTVASVDGFITIGNQSIVSGDLPNSGEPFFFGILTNTRISCMFADGGSHEIAIYDFSQDCETTIYNQIPIGFLPEVALKSELDTKVPTSRTINNKELSTDITLTAEDVGALPDTTNIIGKAGTGTKAELFNDASEASGDYSHAEGSNTIASDTGSHAEGFHTTASGGYSHAEGCYTTASRSASHSEGWRTNASGHYSHAEGYKTTAFGDQSHAEGLGTTTNKASQHVEGEYNVVDASISASERHRGEYVHIVGNGTSDTARSNAHTLDWSGNAWFSGDVYVGSTSGTNKDDGSVKLARISDIPEELTEDEALQILIECEVIDPVTDENSNILLEQNNTILIY